MPGLPLTPTSVTGGHARRSALTILIALSAVATGVVATAASKKAPEPGATRSRQILLRGRIAELSYLCSAAGIGLSGRELPATIAKISQGSAAAYSGLREGDEVINATDANNAIVLTVQRGGKQYQATVAVNVNGLRAEFEARKARFSLGDPAFDEQLSALRNCSVTILLDCSESMTDRDAGCPGDVSKWSWCRQQIDHVYAATAAVLDSGFDLVVFNDRSQVWKSVNLWDLKRLFDRIRPSGSRKDIATPLQTVLIEHLARKALRRRPNLIVVLTDGVQNTGAPLQEVLIDASKKLSWPGQVTVVFLQVGESIMAEELFDDLERNLVAKGAQAHLVQHRTFSELRHKGLLWELVETAQQSLRTGSNQRP